MSLSRSHIQTLTSLKSISKAPILSNSLSTYIQKFAYALPESILSECEGENIEIYALNKSSFSSYSQGKDRGELREEMYKIIDILGQNSSISQNLPHTITTASKFTTNTESQTIYLCIVTEKCSEKKEPSDKKVNTLEAASGSGSKFIKSNMSGKSTNTNKIAVGILKTGIKHLFIRDLNGSLNEFDAFCVLDFYVHDDFQRRRIGKHLFEAMIDDVKKNTTVALYRKAQGNKEKKILISEARHFAYDRPSPKLLAFLKKHYNLSRFVPQANNFVVYNDYFEDTIHEQSPKIEASLKKSITIDSNSPSKYNNSNLVDSPKKRIVLQQLDPISGQIRSTPSISNVVTPSIEGGSSNTIDSNLTATHLISNSSPRQASKMLKSFYETRPRPF